MIMDKIISSETVVLDVSHNDKWRVIEELVALVVKAGKCADGQSVLSEIIDREKRGSTGLVNGVAIPHARSDMVSEITGALAISKNGIDFDSADGKPCHLVFLIIAPPKEATRYLKALSQVALIGSEPGLVSALTTAATAEEVMSILGGNGGNHVR